jgi:protein SYS1
MVSLGIWACRYRELRPISFGIGSAANAASEAQKAESGQGGEGIGDHVRGGRGRGRNRLDGPSYEMVGMKEGNGQVV